MELDYLREFVTLAESGNYLRAADELFIAQSALSRHIQSLEKELGGQLFTRTTRTVRLTECGKIFLPYAKKILAIQQDYKTELYNHINSIGGTLTVGCLPVTKPYHIPEILAKFSKENPHFSVVITQDDSIDQLRNHTADFVFVRETGKVYKDITLIPFDMDSLVALLPEDHPLANEKFLRLEQLKNEHFLFLPKHTQMYELCFNACKAAGFEPSVIYSGPTADNILELVKEHIGIGLLTKKPLSSLNHKRAVTVDIEPKITTAISLAYLKNAQLSVGAVKFIDCVRAFAGKTQQE